MYTTTRQRHFKKERILWNCIFHKKTSKYLFLGTVLLPSSAKSLALEDELLLVRSDCLQMPSKLNYQIQDRFCSTVLRMLKLEVMRDQHYSSYCLISVSNQISSLILLPYQFAFYVKMKASYKILNIGKTLLDVIIIDVIATHSEFPIRNYKTKIKYKSSFIFQVQ